MASQVLLVVLAPTIISVGQDFGVSVGVVGQARYVLAGAAIAASLGIAPLLDRLGVRSLLFAGALLAIAVSAGAALSSTLPIFLFVHAVTGVGFAFLLSAGFAGVASFRGEDRNLAMGYVVGANALAWIIVNPLAGALTDVSPGGLPMPYRRRLPFPLSPACVRPRMDKLRQRPGLACAACSQIYRHGDGSWRR
jgi:MFS family permease